MRIFSLVLLSLLIFSAGQSWAEEDKTDTSKSFDLSVKLGGFSGSITQPGEGGAGSSTFQYGGVSSGIALNHNYSSYATVIFQFGLVTDLSNEQVSRKDFDVGFAYHLLGGSKIHTRNANYSQRVWRNPYNLSFVILLGFHSYHASEKTDISKNITGSVLETLMGAQYRHDINEENSVGIETLHTVFDVPASVERLEPTGSEFSIFWRFLL